MKNQNSGRLSGDYTDVKAAAPGGAPADPFIESLGGLGKNDIVASAASERRRISSSFIIRLTLIPVCLAVFVCCMLLLLRRINDYGKSDSLYDSLSDLWYAGSTGNSNMYGAVDYSVRSNSPAATPDYKSSQSESSSGPVVTVNGDSELLIALKAKMNALKIQNSDFIGWITIDNTVIDYPIVHKNDNSYYLDHSFDKTYSIAGAIFTDCRNKGDFDSNFNTVIYGHNLLNGKMFSDVDKYFTKSFFYENRYVYIYTENGIYVYEVFNIAKVSVSLDYTRTYFATANDFIEFAYSMKETSLYKTDVTFNGNDKIITLSTCTNAHNSAERYCLQAKLVEIQK